MKKKTMEDFTPEIQAKIPEYIKKYTKGVFDGGRYNDFNVDNAKKLIYWNYSECDLKNPVVIVAENPFEAQTFFNYMVSNKEIFGPILYMNYCLLNGIKIEEEVESSQ